jgi:phosphoribosylformylglycinamidine synthase PurS subunit
MKVRVDIKLKNGVLDPQGRAVAHALHSLGFDEVEDVRIGKSIEIDVNTDNKEVAKTRATEMAQKLLANLVIESFEVLI